MVDEQKNEANRETYLSDPERLVTAQDNYRLSPSSLCSAEVARTRPEVISEIAPSDPPSPTFPPDLVNVADHRFPVYRPPSATSWTFPPDLVNVADHEFPVYQPPSAAPWTFPKLRLRYPPFPPHLGRQSSRSARRTASGLETDRRSSNNETQRITRGATDRAQVETSPNAEATVLQPATTVRQNRTAIQPGVTGEQYANSGLATGRPEPNGRDNSTIGSWLVILGIILCSAGFGIYFLIRSSNLG